MHPPVAKQLLALGQAAFGYDGFGWPFPSAVLGVLVVALKGLACSP